jgi:hypothetical protein
MSHLLINSIKIIHRYPFLRLSFLLILPEEAKILLEIYRVTAQSPQAYLATALEQGISIDEATRHFIRAALTRISINNQEFLNGLSNWIIGINTKS